MAFPCSGCFKLSKYADLVKILSGKQIIYVDINIARGVNIRDLKKGHREAP